MGNKYLYSWRMIFTLMVNILFNAAYHTTSYEYESYAVRHRIRSIVALIEYGKMNFLDYSEYKEKRVKRKPSYKID